MHLGEKIKLARVNRGYTQQELADGIGRTRALLSHIEQTGKVNYHTLNAISKFLKLTTEDIELIDKKQIFVKPKSVTENDLLKQEITALKNEIELLKELLETKDKVIKLYEKKR